MLSTADIQAALRDCYDPAIPCNIVDLGLVREIALAPDPDAPGANIPGVPTRYSVIVAVTPTTKDEAAAAQLSAQIQNRLAGLEQVFRSEVTLIDAPAWTPQNITPAGRRLLGLDGNPSLIQISPKVIR
ncbi:iron-sulfur cluster assembly protein [Granulicella sp. dw_53]|uniref:metal-sulfur cluster assembly factor n=1 Tax=Granulicella sp. dw_53 TaxID=2719792 RepID=UPI001BD30BAF|nr:iron-sulfur cluster assembly protein [Granulicella sp. dw_53]